MPRPTRYQKAGKNAAITKQASTSLNKLDSFEKLAKVIEPEKIEIMKLDVEDTAVNAAKGTGKTGPFMGHMQMEMEKDHKASGLAFRKLMKGSKIKLVRTALNNNVKAKHLGKFDVSEWRKSEDGVQLIRDYRNRDNNQAIITSSFENIEDIQGIEAPMAGHFPVVLMDELVPVSEKGSSSIDPDEWKHDVSVIKDSVSRSYNVHKELYPNKSIPKTKYYYSFNPFADHPEIEEMEERFSEDEWMEMVTGVKNILSKDKDFIFKNSKAIIASIKENHTKYKVDYEYNFGRGKAWVRMTKWANPLNRTDAILNEMVNILITKNSSQLSTHYGLKYKGALHGVETYDTSKIKFKDLNDYLKEGWFIESVSVGQDIDISRKLVAQPVLLLKRVDKFNKEVDYKMHITSPSVLQTNKKLREAGMHSTINYTEWMGNTAINVQNTFKCLKTWLIVDDNSETYIDSLKTFFKQHSKRIYTYKAIKKGEQNHWDILHRQDWLNLAIDSKFITFEKSTEDTLINELTLSVRKPGDKQRDEKSSKEKYYDFINALEYGIYPEHRKLFTFLRKKAQNG